MKSFDVNEIARSIEALKSALAAEGEALLAREGEAIARIVRAGAVPTGARSQLPPLKEFRAWLPAMKTSSSTLLRQDRDRRGS